MGGIGSGRTSWGGPPKCEEYRQIDLAWLRRHGMLQQGRISTIQWSRGGRSTGNMGIVASPGAIQLVYRIRGPDEEWRIINECIPLVETETAFGGRRQWFQCLTCGRRCRVLYCRRLFRCRMCHGLSYASQFETPHFRVLSRAQKIRQRLGGSSDVSEPFPLKPKGMHWRTYERLRELHDDLQERWAAGLVGWMRRSLPHH